VFSIHRFRRSSPTAAIPMIPNVAGSGTGTNLMSIFAGVTTT